MGFGDNGAGQLLHNIVAKNIDRQGVRGENFQFCALAVVDSVVWRKSSVERISVTCDAVEQNARSANHNSGTGEAEPPI